MSKNHKNNRFNEPVTPAMDTTVNEAVVEEAVVEEVVVEDTVEPEIETKVGVVTGCARLNVRKEPSKSAAIICEIKENSAVVLAENEPVNGFYKVYTESGASGYCMKDFITVK